MSYDAATSTSQEEHETFISALSEATLAALVAARGNAAVLQDAVRAFFGKAIDANLEL